MPPASTEPPLERRSRTFLLRPRGLPRLLWLFAKRRGAVSTKRWTKRPVDAPSGLAPLLRVRPELQQLCRFGAQWVSDHAAELDRWGAPKSGPTV